MTARRGRRKRENHRPRAVQHRRGRRQGGRLRRRRHRGSHGGRHHRGVDDQVVARSAGRRHPRRRRRPPPQNAAIDSVLVDNRLGARLHRAPARRRRHAPPPGITGLATPQHGDLAGVAGTRSLACHRVDRTLVRRADFREEVATGPRGCSSTGCPPDAIFVTNNLMTWAAAKRRACCAPDDVTLVGFDDARGPRWSAAAQRRLAADGRDRSPGRRAAGLRGNGPPGAPTPALPRWSSARARPWINDEIDFMPRPSAGATRGNPTWTHHRPPRPSRSTSTTTRSPSSTRTATWPSIASPSSRRSSGCVGASTSSSRPRRGGAGAFFDTAPLRRRGRRPVRPGALPRAGRARPARDPVREERQAHRLQAARRATRRRPPLGPHALQAGPHGESAPWHQDEAYWEPDLDYHAVGNWMPLDDADIDNGCLWFSPGSHRLDVLAHKHKGDDPAVHILELVEPVDTSAAVPVPTRAGGAPFHHPHAAPLAAQHDRPRPAGLRQRVPDLGRSSGTCPPSVRGSPRVARPSRPERCSSRDAGPRRHEPGGSTRSSTRGPCRSRARRRARRRRFGGGGTQAVRTSSSAPTSAPSSATSRGPEWCATSGSRSCPPRPSSSAC